MTTLTPAQIAAYQRDGILFPFDVISAEEVAAANAALARLEAAPPAIRKSVVTSKSYLVSRALYDICRKPAIVERVADVLGGDALLWSAGFFVKEARSPQYVSWHQDLTYWGLEPEDVVTAWVALTPSTIESGCMRVVPGSHAGAILPHANTFAATNLLSRGQEIAVQVDEAKAVDVVLAPGQMSLHHVKIAHNSEPNRATHRRAGFAIRYVAPHVRQQKPVRDTATLVFGRDRSGHFDPEPAPHGELTDEDIAAHQHHWLANQALMKAETANT
jgi:ectoine hydroxylase-related dioxygenase (phytanoyl-CoA dioxygenase family)